MREDYCVTCWDANQADSAYSTWTANYYDPKVAEAEPEESFSPLRQTFYKAVEKETRPDLAVAYLAAQLLRRQKVFRLIKESKDPDNDTSTILFNDRIGNRLIEVSDPSLSHAELETARQVLMEALAKLEAPPEVEDAATEDASAESTTDNVADPTKSEEPEGETHAASQETAQVQ